MLFEESVWDNKIKKDPIEVEKYIKSNVPTNTLGEINDVNNAVLFLSSDKSKFISGSIIVVDGGQSRG
jgi:NAD(P)-dependent dehydrogenase (short-subunit alcohol dehydrogenase family)